MCIVLLLGLLGFQLETPTANTGLTLRGLGVRSRQEWFKLEYKISMGRKQLVDIIIRSEGAGRWWQGACREVVAEGQEVWEEWMGQTAQDTDWRGKAKGQWRAMEQVAVRRDWTKDMERDKVYDRG